jgi:glycosyltransferase involved in cell wall biosynthesis
MNSSEMAEHRRILFFVEGEPRYGLSPASRLRAYQYAPLFTLEGIDCQYLPSHPPKYFHGRHWLNWLRHHARWIYRGIVLCGWICMCVTRLWQMRRVRPDDIVVLQRDFLPNSWSFLEKRLARRTEHLVFDLDDAILEQNPHKIPMLLRYARRVIVSTPYLSEQVRPFNPNVTVIPTPVDTDSIKPAPQSPAPSAEPVIGWIGTSGNLTYVRSIEDVFRKMAATSRFRVRIVSNPVCASEYPKLPPEIMETTEWRLDDETAQLQGFDIGIMPLDPGPWTVGKAGFKLLQYMAAGLPVVASPVGFNRELVQHGVNGFLADSPEEWERYLLQLLNDPDLRRRMGQQGRQLVEKEFSLRPTFAKLLHVIDSA